MSECLLKSRGGLNPHAAEQSPSPSLVIGASFPKVCPFIFLGVYVCEHAHESSGAHRSPVVSEPLDLESGGCEPPSQDAGIPAQVSARVVHAFSDGAISLPLMMACKQCSAWSST